MKNVSLLFIFSLFGLLVNSQIVDFSVIAKIKTIQGNYFKIDTIKNRKASVFIFLSPECPLCQKYTLSIKEIENEYKVKEIAFHYVFPGTYYSKKKINRYLIKYGLKSTALLDTDFKATNTFDAKITPEVFLVDINGTVMYSGKIDNWYEDIGKRRTIITEHYLVNALDAHIQGNEIEIKKTQAVGCFIE